MATYGRTLRRGLPRIAGGDAWPAAGDADIELATPERVEGVGGAAEAAVAAASTGVEVTAESAAGAVRPDDVALPAASVAATGVGVTPEPAGTALPLRRGLPRVAGGEPWPPASGAAAVGVAVTGQAPAEASVVVNRADVAPEATPATPEVAPAAAAVAKPVEVAAAGQGVALRRGMPRVAGAEGWPPAGTVSAPVASAVTAVAADVAQTADAAPAPETAPTAEPALVAASVSASAAPVAQTAPTPGAGPVEPLPFTRSAWQGQARRPAPRPEPPRIGPFTKAQWAGAVVIGGGGLLIAAAMAVLFVRWVLSLEFMQDFVATYPGEYHLPEGAPVGLPAWLGWSHFFNAFLMVLIIRSGLQIRREKRPTVFWTPKKDKRGKTSLTIWFHQALDVLWLVNGFVFLVLLFATGQWMRIVPTSWEVFPNAVSAALQYVSLDWPTENGWVNYNSLQQLAYFSVVFLAAPLAAITGYRMSGMWPKKNKTLSEKYPIEWARTVHFPTMLFFVVFIATHVFLVLATGALRNLNHMYAAQGSTDPTAYADNWTGFWMFVASLVVIAAAWIALRPMTIAPIARLFGTVSGR